MERRKHACRPPHSRNNAMTLTAPRVLITALLLLLALSLPVAAETERRASDGTGSEAVRLQLVAPQSVTLSSELSGRIAELPLRPGDAFKKGAQLLAFDCRLHQARWDKAAAERKQASATHEVNIQLDRLGSVSTLELDVSSARLAVAQAELDIMTTLLDRCTINAPFSGRIAEVHVKQHQYIGEGEKVLDILNDRQLEIEMILPSLWLQWLKPGQPFPFRVDETGRDYQARVSRIAPQVDAVSQTVKVFATLDRPSAELRAGMSGTARISPP
ncbi:MAG: efflux transporter periplasmic adaptor subunit [Desulfuromonas sp.]|nr:MAG: efflux transporter periplasmic adaptor subunit [Desulfuromonas sp.]